MEHDSFKDSVAEYLNLFCFQKIWNEPVKEYRSNIKPTKLHDRSQVGSISYSGLRIKLPAGNRSYYTRVTTDSAYYGAFCLTPNKWYSTDTLCTSHSVLLHMYTESGLMFAKGFVWIYYCSAKRTLIFAIDKQMYDSVTEHDLEHNRSVYTTLYYNSSFGKRVNILSKRIPDNHSQSVAVSSEITKFLDSHFAGGVDQRLVFQQGRNMSVSDGYKFFRNDYVDVIVDQTIVATFDVDLTDPKFNRGYLSARDSIHRYIFHMPKALNPENRIYTFNTCDFFVRPKEKSDERGQSAGRYIHLCADMTVSQLTHNDYSIPQYILDAHRHHLENDRITVTVVVRDHEKNNFLLRDKSYIDLLYTHDDEEILDFLAGQGDKRLPFWKADQLEKTKYVEMMFSTPVPVTVENMWDFVEGLGYYHIIALLCSRITTAEVTDADEHIWKWRKSFVYENRLMHAIIYINGEKLLNSKVTIVNSKSHVFTQLHSSVKLEIGDIITCEIFVTGNNNVYYEAVSMYTREFELPYKNPSVYIEEDHSPIVAHGINKAHDKSYTHIDSSINKYILTDTPNGCRISFSSSMYGSQVIIGNSITTYEKVFDLDNTLYSKTSIVMTLNAQSTGTLINVPILNFSDYNAYLNGRYLVPNIDVTVQPIYHPESGNISFYQLIIQNISYLQDTGNTVELLLNGSDKLDQGNGFVLNFEDATNVEVESRIIPKPAITVYFKEITTALINGRFEHKIIDYGKHYEIPVGKYRSHHVFELKTNVPKFLQDFILKYHGNDDYDRKILLNEYFYKKYNEYPNIVILTDSHKLYSVYLNNVINDLVDGILELSYDPDIERLENQLADYRHIKKLDIIYNTEIDFDHIDIYPQYAQSVTNLELKKLIDNLVKLLLPKDINNSGDIVHG